MAECLKNHAIVLMHGMTDEAVDSIEYMIECFSKSDIILYPLDLDHMDKLVFKFKSADEDFEALQSHIEERYPGLFIFDPPMYV